MVSVTYGHSDQYLSKGGTFDGLKGIELTVGVGVCRVAAVGNLYFGDQPNYRRNEGSSCSVRCIVLFCWGDSYLHCSEQENTRDADFLGDTHVQAPDLLVESVKGTV